MKYDAQVPKMKAKDLLRNAIVLSTEGRKGLSDALSNLVREIEFKKLSSLAAYVIAQLDNEKDPVVALMRQASTDEPSRKVLLGQGLKKMSAFNKVLNMRFSAPGTLLVNSDDPALAHIVATLPASLVRKTLFRQTPLQKLERVVDGQLPIASYLQNLATYAQDQHEYRRAQAELHEEVKQGKHFNVFSRMAFLRQESVDVSAHAIRFDDDNGLRFAALKFSPENESAFSDTWYPQEIARTYLFAHELGHCLMPRILHQESVEKFLIDGSQDGLIFREELFADIYSACLTAKITGSWDFLPLCVLPLRAADNSTHNTFDTIQRLPKSGIDPHAFQSLDDHDLVRAAENIYRDFVDHSMNTSYKPLHDAAALMMSYSRQNLLDTPETFEKLLNTSLEAVGCPTTPDNQQLATQFMMRRVQAEIDLIGMRANMGISSQWVCEGLRQLAQGIHASGSTEAAANVLAIAGLEDQAMRAKMFGFMSEQAIGTLENYEQSAMSVGLFWEEWKYQERQMELNAGSSLSGERALGR
jgi:hypothetical protein